MTNFEEGVTTTLPKTEPQKKTLASQFRDSNALKELGFRGAAPLGQFARALPNPQRPFAAENLEHIKTLIKSDDNEAYNDGDRMTAAIVAITNHAAALKTEPIEYLKDIDRHAQRQNKDIIGMKLDQLKAISPGSKRANGPYDKADKSDTQRLAPILALTAIDGFIEENTFINHEHDNPQPFKLSSNDVSQILNNIFLITKS